MKTPDTLTDLGMLLLENIKKTPVPLDQHNQPSEPARLLYGRGGRCPGLYDINIDIFPPLLFITLYREYSHEEVEVIANQIKTAFPENPVLIQDRSTRPAITRLKKGEVPEELVIRESGLEYLVNPERGQNAGFFTDMRNGRTKLSKLIEALAEKNCAENEGMESSEIQVLNLFAYTCSFSVVAAAAGADKIINIDMNRRSLEIGKRNHRLNHKNIPGGYINQAKFLSHDIFKSFGKLKKEGPYDIIIADPPPSQKGSFMMLKDYPRLLKRLPEMLKPEGKILLTHNGPGWSWEEFEKMALESLPGFFISEYIEPPIDFAPKESGRGLKTFIMGIINE
ncbi:MAG: class I SAM-dependent methyltransferase [Spirochaetales bacterium]|nr:class I SAM-dependent methyltransferase [Spirochaetales bacterium]